jgi:PhzF family phenazine biosynthesis protein
MWRIWGRFALILIVLFVYGEISAQQATAHEEKLYCMSPDQTELKVDMKCDVYIVRAFCRDQLGGNLAGVVLEQGFTAEQMQAIAKKLNFSETIFISKQSPTLYKALYFTPSSSIDFCGHATIAAFGVLREINHLKNGIYQLEIPVGIYEVALNDSLIFLSQPLPVFGEFIPVEEVASVLGISVSDIQSTHLNPQIVSTGLRDIFVSVATQDCLFGIHPNDEQITTLSEKYDAIGLHVFSLESSEIATTAFCRNFAPRYGIPEESATGSSNGALGCYLFQRDILSPNERHTLLFKQGDLLNAPSNIYVHLITKDKKIKKVECGGKAIIDEIRTLHLE